MGERRLAQKGEMPGQRGPRSKERQAAPQLPRYHLPNSCAARMIEPRAHT